MTRRMQQDRALNLVAGQSYKEHSYCLYFATIALLMVIADTFLLGTLGTSVRLIQQQPYNPGLHPFHKSPTT